MAHLGRPSPRRAPPATPCARATASPRTCPPTRTTSRWRSPSPARRRRRCSAKVPDGVAVSSLCVSDGAPVEDRGRPLQITLPAQAQRRGAHRAVPPRWRGPGGRRRARRPSTCRSSAAPRPSAGRATSTSTAAATTWPSPRWRARARPPPRAGAWPASSRARASRIAVSAVPMPVRRQAVVETLYAVSEYRVTGTHRVTLATEGAQATALTLLLAPGQTARSVTGDVRDWSQEGASVRIRAAREARRGGAGAGRHRVPHRRAAQARTRPADRRGRHLQRVLHGRHARARGAAEDGRGAGALARHPAGAARLAGAARAAHRLPLPRRRPGRRARGAARPGRAARHRAGPRRRQRRPRPAGHALPHRHPEARRRRRSTCCCRRA